MKDKVIRLRVDDDFIKMIKYIMTINGYKTTSEAIRAIVSKEYQRETFTTTK